jgi:hypothetical protein
VESKQLTKDFVARLINTQDYSVIKALLALYAMQTEEERRQFCTKVSNNLGFTAYDASLLTSYAEKVISGRKLTGREIYHVRLRINKYVNQLIKLADCGFKYPARIKKVLESIKPKGTFTFDGKTFSY